MNPDMIDLSAIPRALMAKFASQQPPQSPDGYAAQQPPQSPDPSAMAMPSASPAPSGSASPVAADTSLAGVAQPNYAQKLASLEAGRQKQAADYAHAPADVQGKEAHGMKRALQILAGIGMGAAAFNPAAGMGMYSVLHNAPLRRFNQNVAQSNANINAQEGVLKEEQAADLSQAQLEGEQIRNKQAAMMLPQRNSYFQFLQQAKQAWEQNADPALANPQQWKQMLTNQIAQHPEWQAFAKPTDIDAIMQTPQASGYKINMQDDLPMSVTLHGKEVGLDDKGLPPEIAAQIKARREAHSAKLQEGIDKENRQFEHQLARMKAMQNGTTRLDRSYTVSDSKLDKLGSPVEAVSQRLANLGDSLKQGTPQADALVAPELLSIMAGGQGSGLRMNEAEIERVVGGRSKWETLKAHAQQWSVDPKTANSITPEQRQEIHALYNAVNKRIQAKMNILNDARDKLLDAQDPHEHRQIVNDVHRLLTLVDQGQQQQQQQQGGQLQPPSEAQPGMKWQHRTINGKVEWRQVPKSQ